MSLEGAHDQQDRERKKKEKREQKESADTTREFRRKKEILSSWLDKKKMLDFLESMVKRGILKKETAKAIIANESLDADEGREMYAKIDAIEEVNNIEKILPKELRLTKDEYNSALKNSEKRAQAIQKIEQALYYIANTNRPRSSTPFGVFCSFFAVLDTSLRTVQENSIDLKRNLASKK